jgi:hypothetical protein
MGKASISGSSLYGNLVYVLKTALLCIGIGAIYVILIKILIKIKNN